MRRLRRAAPLLVLGAFAVNAALQVWLEDVHAPQREAEEQAWCDARPPPNYFCFPGFDPIPHSWRLFAEAAVLLVGAGLAVWGFWLDRRGWRPWAGAVALALGIILLWDSRKPTGLCVNADCLPDRVSWALALLGGALIVLCALAFFLGPADDGPADPAQRDEVVR